MNGVRPAVGLLAPCEIRWISALKGYGIFASGRIPKGALLWRYSTLNTREFTVDGFRQHLAALPTDAARIRLLRTAYGCHGKMVLPLDDSVFWNHSTMPNCTGAVDAYALHDISVDEELLCNYLEFEYPQWLRDLYMRYDIDTSFLWSTSQQG